MDGVEAERCKHTRGKKWKTCFSPGHSVEFICHMQRWILQGQKEEKKDMLYCQEDIKRVEEWYKL